MPAFDVALVELGKLIGLFKPDGELDWSWFGDPVTRGFTTMPAERARIGALVRALADRPTEAEEFSPEHGWEPFIRTDNVGLGVVWTKLDPLRIALGAKADLTVGGKPITLGALAQLIEVANGTAAPELGTAALHGTFPVPDFLSAGTIAGELSPTEVTVGLGAANTSGQDRLLEYPNPVIAWDTMRLAVFVLRAWISQRAAEGDGVFFNRIDEHLFPMLGDPPGVIKAFPIVDQMGAAPNFDPWRSSVLSTDNNASGALTFLWRLRALLTGNEDPNFLDGSLFFPVTGAPSNGIPPTPANSVGPYVRPPGTDGAWVGLLTEPGDTFTLVLDLQTASGQFCRIPLARSVGAVFDRPVLDASWTAVVGAIAAGPGLPIGGELLTATPDGTGFRLSLLRETVAGSGVAGFDGEYDLALRLQVGEGVEVVVGTPVLDLIFPPEGNAEARLGDVVAWALRAAAPDTALGTLITTFGDHLHDRLSGGAPDPMTLLAALAGVAGQAAEDAAPVDLAITDGRLELGAPFGPVENEDVLPVFIGRVSGKVVIDPAAAEPVEGFALTLENLRLHTDDTGPGIVGSLIPNLRELPGFQLAVGYGAGKVTVTGGGKIPVQRTLGPLQIAALLVDVRERSVAIGLDLGLELGPIHVAAYELGLRYGFDGDSVEPFLHGLGLAMDAPPIKLGGFFAAVESGPAAAQVTDYVGGATVSVAGYFELSAIGGYTQVDGEPSLFIFASLVAPLGGPPFFFVTGIAGGFGFNRALPDPELMIDHPFLKVMRGEIDVSGPSVDVLKELSSKHFVVQHGQHWIAAGISFTAFGFIDGKIVIVIGFGHSFSFTILGMASFAIPPICYIEIGILVTADEEHFLMRARLSPNSYLLHPDIFSMQGDIALGAWYSGEHEGDFLFSIGGYHPLFKKPAHYPELLRVGCKATIYSFVHLTVEVFFCCTPQALMAGARVSLWAEFAGISAGLDVYVDVLMQWNPFYLEAGLGVCVWFEFFGRHEIGVDLHIWTPDFGGIAVIDLALVEFEVEFGVPKARPKPPPLTDFLTKQIGLPAEPYKGVQGAQVAAFSTDRGKGLFRIEFLSGRVGNEPSKDQEEKQEGLVETAPVLMSAEWSFLFRTMLPMNGAFDLSGPAPTDIQGEIDLPLCQALDQASTLRLGAPGALDRARRSWLADFFPAADFGPDPVPEAQLSARDAVTQIKSEQPTVPLIEGMVVDCSAVLSSAEDMVSTTGELSAPGEFYPLPLGAEPGGSGFGLIKERLAFGPASDLAVTYAGAGPTRREKALQALASATPAPFTVRYRAAELQNAVRVSAGRTYTFTTNDEFRRMAPPPSPARPTELFGIGLRVLPLRSNDVIPRAQMETVSPPRGLEDSMLTPDDGVLDPLENSFEVESGRAALIDIGGGGITAGAVRLEGDQSVRTVVLDRGGAVVADAYTSGSSAVELPRGAANVIIVGEGRLPTPLELGRALGVERNSTLLACGSRTFLAQGCVVTAVSGFDLAVTPMDSLPGIDVLDRASLLGLAFSTPPPLHDPGESTAVIKVLPTVDRPAPAAEQVHWLAEGATFGALVPVVAADRVAFVLPVRAPDQWRLTVDLGPDWRLDGVVYAAQSPRSMVAALQTSLDWDLIDDSVPADHRQDPLRSAARLEARQ